MLSAMLERFAMWWTLRRQRLHAVRLSRASVPVPLVMRLIAAGKLLKAIGFLFLGLCIVRLAHAPNVERWASDALQVIHIDPDGQHAQQVLSWLSSIPHARLVAVGAGAFGYATLYLIEGLGLWFDRPWAEWLTVFGTCVFIPFEVIHLVNRPSFGIAVVLVLNVLIAIYLGRRLRKRRGIPGSEPVGPAAG